MGNTVVSTVTKKTGKGGRKGGGAKKIGRHKAHCQRYRLENRFEKNKLRKQRTHENKVAKKKLKKEK